MRTRDDLVRGWLEKARRDLLAAERALSGNPPLTDIACFHAQQTVEKALKALLTASSITPPRTHALEDLALMAAQLRPEAERFVAELATLTPYAVTARYPEFSEPSVEEATAAIDVARRLIGWVQEALESR